ncbi:MAG: flippase-like domain-containing protein [Xanthomonadales bacterium]|nr:flippase-like domain-containing protein [Xanthomonadales bacterium]
MRARALTSALKWAWIVVVIGVAGLMVWRARADIVAMLAQLSWVWLAASTALLLAAKLLLAQNARIAARRVGLDLDFATAARLYNLSQLGKYLPGSIWQFVGRAAAYRDRGGEYGQIRDALLVETLWVIAGAATVAVALSGPSILAVVMESLSPLARWWLSGLVATTGLGLFILLIARRNLVTSGLRLALPSWPVLAVQAGIWILLGLSFWVLAWACGMGVGVLPAIGLFAGAYAIGFLVPFAPAGLGVREGILVLGLLPWASAGEALAVTVMARVVYLVVELGLVLVQEAMVTARGRKGERDAQL